MLLQQELILDVNNLDKRQMELYTPDSSSQWSFPCITFCQFNEIWLGELNDARYIIP